MTLARPSLAGAAGFNEAPAERGGRLAERCLVREGVACFNEAPAERGGRQGPDPALPIAQQSFNEAPAERGGRRRPVALDGMHLLVASMRPPQNAGEDDEPAIWLSTRPSLQ